MHPEKLVKLFQRNYHKLSELMRTILSIDRERNGYVTSTELDDILKMIFNAKEMSLLNNEGLDLTSLDGYDLKPLLRPFASSANRVLIDYKRFRDFLVKGVAKMNYEIKKKQQLQLTQDQRRTSANESSQNGDQISLKRASELIEGNLEHFNSKSPSAGNYFVPSNAGLNATRKDSLAKSLSRAQLQKLPGTSLDQKMSPEKSMQDLSIFKRSPERLLTSNAEIRSKTGSKYKKMSRNLAGIKTTQLSVSCE